MPHRLSLCLAFLVLTTTVFAQRKRAKIRWSERFKINNLGTPHQLLIADDEALYAPRSPRGLFSSNQRFAIDKYDKQRLRLKRQETFNLRYEKSASEYDFVLPFGERLWLFLSNNDRSAKTNRLLAQEISLDRLEEIGEPRLVATADAKLLREGEFDYQISPDSTHLLIYNTQPIKRREAETFDLRIFNRDMTLQWERSVTLPYTRDLFDVKNLQVDDQGNAYVLGVVFSERFRLRRNRQATYRYVVLAYRPGGEAAEYTVDLADVFINGMALRVNDRGELICNGLYSNRNTGLAKGAFYARIDPESKAIVAQNLKEFDIDVITQRMGGLAKNIAERREEKGNKRRAPELASYAIRDIILRSDGGSVMLAEQFFVTQSTTTTNGVTNTTYTYHYNDILVTNIRPDGEIEWTVRVPKGQRTTDDGGYASSFVHAVSQGKIHLLFNDHPKNYKRAERRVRPRVFAGRKKTAFTLASIDTRGDVTYRSIGEGKKAKAILLPRRSQQVGKHEIGVIGKWRRKFRIGVVEL